MSKMASLILEDGTTFKGLLFGANVSVSGEVGEFVSFSVCIFIGTVICTKGLFRRRWNVSCFKSCVFTC